MTFILNNEYNKIIDEIKELNPYSTQISTEIQKTGYKKLNVLVDTILKFYNNDNIKNIIENILDDFGNTLIHILAIINNGDILLKKIFKYFKKNNLNIDFNICNENSIGGLHPPIIKAARYGKLKNYLFFYDILTYKDITKVYSFYNGKLIF